MIGWWIATVTAILLTFLSYVAFFWKINWVKGLDVNTNSRNGGSGYGKNRKIGKIPPVYPNGWFGLLESWQLAKGEVKHVAALGENFAVFRSEKGQVNILDAYCPHLGANLAEGGKVKGDCLECPFHGWIFQGNDGVCQSIPYAEKVPASAKTKAWKCCEVNEIIFVWYHAESAEPNWQPEPLENISSGAWRCHGRNEFLINCHVQEIPENGADWAHLSAVHGPALILNDVLPGFMRHSWTGATWSPPKTRLGDLYDEDNDSKAIEKQNGTSENSEGSNLIEDKRHIASIALKHSVVLFERFTLLELDVTAEQIGPGYVELLLQSSFGPMLILQTVTPVAPMVQRVIHIIFSAPLLAPYAKICFLGEGFMFSRDVDVWNHKKFENKPVLVREDRSILAFRRWYSQFYSPKSPTYQSVKSLDW